MLELNVSSINYDCVHFKGGIPCKPSKVDNSTCVQCAHYQKIEKRILIIKLGALGDVIRTTPLILKYKELYPNAHFTWLTLSPDVLPSAEIHEILKPDAFSLFTLLERNFDIAINLDKEEEACRLLSKVEAKEKFGYTWNDGHIAAATKAAEHKLMTGFFDEISKKNTKSYLQEIFDICHLPFNGENYLIRKDESLIEKWKIHFKELAGNKTIVGLNTGCGPRWNTRLWTDEYWVEVALELKKRGYFPVFLGGALEHEKNLRLSQNSDCYYPGHYSLEEFIALTDSTEFVVTQVSMMMHIATALQKKLILMNNIFNPYEFELYGRGKIVQPKTECMCYFGNSCLKGANSCMHELFPHQIIDAITELSN